MDVPVIPAVMHLRGPRKSIKPLPQLLLSLYQFYAVVELIVNLSFIVFFPVQRGSVLLIRAHSITAMIILSHFLLVIGVALSIHCQGLNSLCHHFCLGVCLGASRSSNRS